MRLILFIYATLFVSQIYAQKSDFKHLDFKKADSIALAYKDASLHNLSRLSYQLTSDLNTDAEKFRAIYKWVCTNIANDYSQYSKNKRKRYKLKDDSLELNGWNTSFRKIAFRKLVKDHKATCTGYAYLVKELSKYAKLECEMVNGYAKTGNTNIEKMVAPNHSWNAIKLKGKWYLCDPTWASGIQDPETLQFVFKYNDGFFLTQPKLFAVNHHPEDSKWLLFDQHQPTYQDFIDAPILYGEAYNMLSNHDLPNQMHQDVLKHETITFKYKLQHVIDTKKVHFLIDNGHKLMKATPKQINLKHKQLTLEHSFSSTGFYDLHVFVGDDIISTYTFKVTRLSKAKP